VNHIRGMRVRHSLGGMNWLSADAVKSNAGTVRIRNLRGIFLAPQRWAIIAAR
jgi:hypothetical protein